MNASDIFFGLFEKSGSENFPTHIESVSYDLTFHDLLIDMKTTQKFTNRSKDPVELVYKYRSDAAPHFMEVTLYDPETQRTETLRAKIHRKEAAREKYDDAIAEGGRGVLMEQDEDVPNVYCLSLGNIKPKMEISISTCVVSTATLETDEEDCDRVNFMMTIPAMTTEVSEVEEARRTMDVTINAIGATSVISPSHDNSLSSVGEGRWRTQNKVSVTREFEIMVTYVKYPFSTFTVSRTNFKNYKYSGILSLMPNFAAQPSYGHELILIVDCSGSMSGSRMKCAVETLKLFMQSLDSDRRIKYNIIRFGSRYEKLFEESVELKDDRNFERAKTYVGGLDSSMGGTNMLRPIQSLFQKKKEKITADSFFDYTDPRKEKIPEYVRQNVCTFKLTKKEFCVQKWYNCAECCLIVDIGCCESCALTCHRGHKGLRESPKSPSSFFCDCGADDFGTCRAMRNEIDHFLPPTTTTETPTEPEYVKQLFLFTDGEDEYPTEIEQLVERKHKECGLRVFSFGIGRGINQRFLRNVAEKTNGSACFITNIKSEMKAMVIRQLSNAFRTSINEIEYTKGLSGLDRSSFGVVTSTATDSSPPLIFNGRSYHEYFFLEKLPEEIEVKYKFLGIESSESVTIRRIFSQDDHQQQRDSKNSAISVRVANEFVKKRRDNNFTEEELGLHFQLPTKQTSFFLESVGDETVRSEMKVETIKPTIERNDISLSSPSFYPAKTSRNRSLGLRPTTTSYQDNRDLYILKLPSSASRRRGRKRSKGKKGRLSLSGLLRSSSSKKKKKSLPGIEGSRSSNYVGSDSSSSEMKNYSWTSDSDDDVDDSRNNISRLRKMKSVSRSSVYQPPSLGNLGNMDIKFSKKKKTSTMKSKPMSRRRKRIESRRRRGRGRRGRRGRKKSRSSSSSTTTTTKSKRNNVIRSGYDDVEGDSWGDDSFFEDLKTSQSSTTTTTVPKKEVLLSFFDGDVEDDNLVERSESRTTTTTKDDIDAFFSNPAPKPRSHISERLRRKLGLPNPDFSRVRKSVSSENLSSLLLQCNMKGIWSVSSSQTLRCLGFSSREEFLKSTKYRHDAQDNIQVDFWLSSIVLAILNRFYKRKKKEWSLIYRKSCKNILMRFPSYISQAKAIVNEF